MEQPLCPQRENISFSQPPASGIASTAFFRTVPTGLVFWHIPSAPHGEKHPDLCSQGLRNLLPLIPNHHPRRFRNGLWRPGCSSELTHERHQDERGCVPAGSRSNVRGSLSCSLHAKQLTQKHSPPCALRHAVTGPAGELAYSSWKRSISPTVFPF